MRLDGDSAKRLPIAAGGISLLPDVVTRLVRYLKRHGLRRTLGRAATSLRQGIFANRKLLFYCDLRGFSGSVLPGHLRVQQKRMAAELTEQDWRQIATVWDLASARTSFHGRFMRGACMWLIQSHGKFAGYGWTLKGDTILPHYHPLGEHDTHLFDFLVFPEFRGQQMNSWMVNEILGRLAAQGEHRAYIETSEWNLPMLQSLRRTGFQPFAIACKLTLLGRTFVQWKGTDKAWTASSERRTK